MLNVLAHSFPTRCPAELACGGKSEYVHAACRKSRPEVCNGKASQRSEAGQMHPALSAAFRYETLHLRIFASRQETSLRNTPPPSPAPIPASWLDRKSTRLNSSH